MLSTIATYLRNDEARADGAVALLGCHGSGMTALGEILADLGHRLVGFDQSVRSRSSDYGLRATLPRATLPRAPLPLAASEPWEWNSALASETAVCIHSPAVKPNDALLSRFAQHGIPTCSLHQALNAVFAKHHQVCVAGTHGKSTTTAMLSWILDQSEFRPGYFVGAKFCHNGRSGRSVQSTSIYRNDTPTKQPSAVIESCEFNRSFHLLSPSTIVLTGMERDHFDCFESEQAEDKAFEVFIRNMGPTGTVIFNADCSRSRRLIQRMNCKSISFCLNHDGRETPDVDFRISNVEQIATGIQMEIQSGLQSRKASVPAYGIHNAANASAAIAAAVNQGVCLADAVAAMSSFPGIERRFQDRGTFRGMVLIDDYAHHPTAIRTTLQAARKRFPHREIRVCFEPHQLIRLAELKNEFVDALSLADMVYVLPVLAARESASSIICHRESHKLINCLRSVRTSAFFSPNLDHVVRTIDHSANPNAVLLTMGAGCTHLIHDKLTDRLRQYSVA